MPGFIRLLFVLTRQELRGRFSGIWFWAVSSAVCLMAALYGDGFQRSFETETVLVSQNPLAALNVIAIAVISIVFGLRLATSVSWEREHRTFEVLLVSPANHSTILLAKLFAEIVTMIALLAVYSVYLLLAEPLGAGVITIDDTVDIWSIGVFVLPILGLGLLVSSFLSTVRASVVSFLVAVSVLSLIEIVTQVLRVQSPSELNLAVLYLRSGLEALHSVLNVLSPISYVSDVVLSAANVTVLTTERLFYAFGLTVALFFVSNVISSRKGPQ